MLAFENLALSGGFEISAFVPSGGFVNIQDVGSTFDHRVTVTQSPFLQGVCRQTPNCEVWDSRICQKSYNF